MLFHLRTYDVGTNDNDDRSRATVVGLLVRMIMMIVGESLWWGLGVEVSYDDIVACSLLSGGCAII